MAGMPQASKIDAYETEASGFRLVPPARPGLSGVSLPCTLA
jgi:hypothetical protein